MDRIELGKTLNLSEELIAVGKKNRPSTAIAPTTITIHNTDNASPGANAAAHSRFVRTKGYYDMRDGPHWVSWHFSVDDVQTIKQLPIDEMAFHALGAANRSSIAIEICMNAGIDQTAANGRAARLAAALLYDLQLSADAIRSHHDWTGKDCPTLLLPTWDNFTQDVAKIRDAITGPRGGLEFDAAEILSGIESFVEREHGPDDHAALAADSFWSEPINLFAARTGADRVAEARRLVKAGGVYPQGCSEFICAVLGVSPWENANALMGASPTSLGTTPPYAGLQAGDVVGWKEPSASGHVALYMGPSDTEMFADVRAPGAVPRLKNGYYGREIFKSSRF